MKKIRLKALWQSLLFAVILIGFIGGAYISGTFNPNNKTVENLQDEFHKQEINKGMYIQGCAMKGGRILRQMEILVDGQVVLCCDDADGKTNYGNVFKDGIEQTWQKLQDEHTLIFEQKFSNDKKHLICNSCSRGRFKRNWGLSQRLIVEDKQKFLRILQKLYNDINSDCEIHDKIGKFKDNIENFTLKGFRAYKKGLINANYRFDHYEESYTLNQSYMNAKGDHVAKQCEVLMALDKWILPNGKTNSKSILWIGYKY